MQVHMYRAYMKQYLPLNVDKINLTVAVAEPVTSMKLIYNI
jgi:uncharacterized membrane protein